MAASLDPVRQKILWAAKHLDALEVEIIRYFDTDPAEVVTEDDFEAKTKWVTFKLRKPVPDPILFITGDVIQNLRSSLDYLVRELVIAANEQPTDKEVFPICDSPKGFNEAIRRGACGALVDVPGREAIAEIERLQPYNAGKEKNFLWVLNYLCNVNKHRRILVALLNPTAHRARWTAGDSIAHTQGLISNVNTEIVERPAEMLGKEVQVEGEVIALITFNEGAAKDVEIISYLSTTIKHLSVAVIPRFERFFA